MQVCMLDPPVLPDTLKFLHLYFSEPLCDTVISKFRKNRAQMDTDTAVIYLLCHKTGSDTKK